MAPPGLGPERTCVACRTKLPVTSLVRYVRNADGTVVADPTGPGRGAWVCAGAQCLATAARTGAFSRAFRAPSRLGDT